MNISAVIPIYQPDPKILNRCLYLVAPQVDEVIITAEGKSIIPENVLKHPKIKVVQTDDKGIGFGRNVNFGAKHASGKWLLILNDDVHLNPDAVAKMTEVIQPDTGIVVHLLRYPDRKIFATVCARLPGAKAFHQVDQNKLETSLKDVVEVENACGASWLVLREAFQKLNGYDESFWPGYCEDNDLSLRMRLHGWKILYTPHAKGWHIGHQSFRKLGDPNELCKPSIALFNRKWGAYLEANAKKIPGDFSFLDS